MYHYVIVWCFVMTHLPVLTETSELLITYYSNMLCNSSDLLDSCLV